MNGFVLWYGFIQQNNNKQENRDMIGFTLDLIAAGTLVLGFGSVVALALYLTFTD